MHSSNLTIGIFCKHFTYFLFLFFTYLLFHSHYKLLYIKIQILLCFYNYKFQLLCLSEQNQNSKYWTLTIQHQKVFLQVNYFSIENPNKHLVEILYLYPTKIVQYNNPVNCALFQLKFCKDTEMVWFFYGIQKFNQAVISGTEY